MRVGELFAGIGGFSLGFERAGMQTVWQVEQSEFCREVLARHFPDAQRFEDVREVGARNLEPVDLICGGVPCQPVSVAGKGLGEADERWLWPDTVRIIGELRPRYAVLENPPALLGRGLVGVLGKLAEIGYDAEWSVVSAADMGAPHLRQRVWIVAYPQREGLEGLGAEPGVAEVAQSRDGGALAHPAERPRIGGVPRSVQRPVPRGAEEGGRRHPWQVEPNVGRVADGVPARVDRLRALGNALVPQIAEFIGQRILDYERDRMNSLAHTGKVGSNG